MGARTTAREAALQMLFAIDAGGEEADRVIRDFWRELPGDAEGRPYADAAVRGVSDMRGDLDERIGAASQHWKVSRMARVDRNVLRLGTWELLTQTETPAVIVVDEAVDLSKRYGNESSGSFVNGILARIASELGRDLSGAAAVGARPSEPDPTAGGGAA